MKKAVIGTFLGAVVYFAWGAVSWMVLPWHAATMKALPNETLLLDTMKTVVKEPGLYAFPAKTGDNAAWTAKYRTGPAGLLAYAPVGGEPVASGALLANFAFDVLLAALLMWILWASRLRRLVHQIHLTAAVGLVAGFAVCIPLWDWMTFPTGYTVVSILDLLVGFILMGIAMGPLVPAASRE